MALTAPRVELDWDPDGSRADLLHPRYGVVPFLGRTELLSNLMLWREHPDPLRVVVLTGAGGFGKTRTAIEVCIEAARAGWTVGLLALADERRLDRVADLRDWPGRLLVAVDYAETRPHAVIELLLALRRRPPDHAGRAVLITRQASTRPALRELFTTGDTGPELAGLIQVADIVRMDQDVEEVDRSELFTVAANEFAARLRRPWSGRVPALAADHFRRPLYVLVAALLTIEDADLHVDDLAAEELLCAVLDRHEAEYWDRWNRRLGTGLTREDQRRAVAWAALLGANTEDDALALAQSVPGFADSSGERRRAVARWLAHLYGSGRLADRPAVAPLEPDLLAEALIARELVTDGDT
ncbi:MAG TPA: hypothetical protein VFB74_14560 [Kribbellaceae bacterium]|nr:hypothetical protein [Kribbellaceae bacterium]